MSCGQFVDSIHTPVDRNIIETIRTVDQELKINDLLPGLFVDEPTAILLDANNLYRRARENGVRIDYVKLRNLFSTRCNLQYKGIFTAVDRDEVKANDWVTYMVNRGFTVIDKDLKKYITADDVLVKKGNMDIEMTIGALSLPEVFTHIILGTCDEDFVPLIKKLRKDKLKKVSVLGMSKEDGTGMPSNLIKSSNRFYDMQKLSEFISYRKSDL